MRPLPLYSEQRGHWRAPCLLCPVSAPASPHEEQSPGGCRQPGTVIGSTRRRSAQGFLGDGVPTAPAAPALEPPGSGCACGTGFPGRSHRSSVLSASSVHCLDLSRPPPSGLRAERGGGARPGPGANPLRRRLGGAPDPPPCGGRDPSDGFPAASARPGPPRSGSAAGRNTPSQPK